MDKHGSTRFKKSFAHGEMFTKSSDIVKLLAIQRNLTFRSFKSILQQLINMGDRCLYGRILNQRITSSLRYCSSLESNALSTPETPIFLVSLNQLGLVN